MLPKLGLKRIGISTAFALLASLLIAAAPAQSSTGGTKVTERLSNASPSTSTAVHFNVCWSKAQRGDTVELEVQSSSSLSWRAVSHESINSTNGCEHWTRTSGAIGSYPYRAEILSGRSVSGLSSVTLERTFGTISAASFFNAEFGCQGSGTVSNGTQTYGYFCSLRAGTKAQSDYITFSRPTTCRSLTLSMIATGDAAGNPADASSVVVEIQQDNNVQPAIFTDNVLEKFTYHLSAHAAAFNIWDNPGNSDGDSAYFLTDGSTAICSSRTGV